MAQHDYVIANGTGAAVRSDLNNALAAIVSQNSGATAPATTYAYQFWADTTTNLLKLRNSANSAWITLFQLDGEWSTLPVENGTAAAPSIYFKDSGTDTGIYSPGTDQVAISTNGTGRLFVDASGRIIVGAATAAIGNPVEVVGNSTGLAIGIRGRSSDNIGSIGFYQNNSATEYARIQSNGDSSLAFGTGSSGTERMRLDSSGRLGIGTTSPSDPSGFGNCIDIRSPTGAAVYLRDSDDSVNDAFVIGRDNSDSYLISASGNMLFSNNGSERARIDSSGRLLVGTSSARSNFFNDSTISPGFQLEAAGTSTAPNRFASMTHGDNNADGPIFVFAKHRSTTIGNTTVVSSSDQLGRISFQGADGTEFVGGAEIKAEVDGTPGANDMPGRLVFSTTADGASSPTERMRISNVGEISTYSTDNNLTLRSSQAAGTTYNFIAGLYGASSTTSGGTVSFVVRNNGDVRNTNGTYSTVSDLKLKENVVDAASQWDDIKAIQIRNWNFKKETGYETHRQIGPIAQELEAVCPNLVIESADIDDEGNDLGTVTKSVNQSVLYMKAVKALQEAMERIEQLEAKVAALESA